MLLTDLRHITCATRMFVPLFMSYVIACTIRLLNAMRVCTCVLCTSSYQCLWSSKDSQLAVMETGKPVNLSSGFTKRSSDWQQHAFLLYRPTIDAGVTGWRHRRTSQLERRWGEGRTNDAHILGRENSRRRVRSSKKRRRGSISSGFAPSTNGEFAIQIDLNLFSRQAPKSLLQHENRRQPQCSPIARPVPSRARVRLPSAAVECTDRFTRRIGIYRNHFSASLPSGHNQ